MRLVDEYDDAQERGEIAGVGKPVIIPDGNNKPCAADLGISSKDIFESRQLRSSNGSAEPFAYPFSVAPPAVTSAFASQASKSKTEPSGTVCGYCGVAAPVKLGRDGNPGGSSIV